MKKQPSVKRIKVEFSPDEPVTSFGGLAVAKRLMLRLGVDSVVQRHLPARRGYSLPQITLSAVAGLLSGARGTVATEALRHDGALRAIFGLQGAAEEATFWRALNDAGSPQALEGYARICSGLARRALSRSPRIALVDGAFVPVFVDGSLLEGSARREGTKELSDKGKGLMWTAAFVGPYPVAQALAAQGPGESETTHARALLRHVCATVLEPTDLKKDALVLMDSLHGNGPTLEVAEELGVSYIIGARALQSARAALAQQPESQWTATPEYDARHGGIEESAVCVATVQCEPWTSKRTIVGRRWKRKGEMIWNYTAVLTNLQPGDKRLKIGGQAGGFAKKIWELYNRKGACENHFKNLLSDLGLHHPPCQQWRRNAGFYALGLLAGLIGVACDVLTSAPSRNRRRIATLRRWLFAVPARVACHGRTAKATILGLSDWWRSWLDERFERTCRC